MSYGSCMSGPFRHDKFNSGKIVGPLCMACCPWSRCKFTICSNGDTLVINRFGIGSTQSSRCFGGRSQIHPHHEFIF